MAAVSPSFRHEQPRIELDRPPCLLTSQALCVVASDSSLRALETESADRVGAVLESRPSFFSGALPAGAASFCTSRPGNLVVHELASDAQMACAGCASVSQVVLVCDLWLPGATSARLSERRGRSFGSDAKYLSTRAFIRHHVLNAQLSKEQIASARSDHITSPPPSMQTCRVTIKTSHDGLAWPGEQPW